jgi:Rps23 Pro-64 3,4-dihydroxylase Tpa1-like proline 4-hydroxylase
MGERLVTSLLKGMNIKSVYYYNSNYEEAGRVDKKFLPSWNKFIADTRMVRIVANNDFLGDTLPNVLKMLFINFTLFDKDNNDENEMFTLKYTEDEQINTKTLLGHIIEQQSTFVNIDKLHTRLVKCITYPFPYAVIDDFLEPDSLTKLLAEVNKLQDADAQTKMIDVSSPYEFNKYAFTTDYSPYLKRLFVELNSPEFVQHIEKITGVKNIICNELSLYGTGIHRIKSKGFSQLHTDFNTYHSQNRKLDRRVNMFIYLNPDWKTEYKGQLCLCDKNTNMCAKQIEPLMNRCVIFNIASSSIYGQPEPLNIPEGAACQYIAVHYCTENTQGDKCLDFEGEAPHNTMWYPNIDVNAKPKQIFLV